MIPDENEMFLMRILSQLGIKYEHPAMGMSPLMEGPAPTKDSATKIRQGEVVMSEWILEENVTDLADSKLLGELGVMEGVEPDGKHYSEYKYRAGTGGWTDWVFLRDIAIPISDTREKFVFAYRQDKLLSRLPEWVWNDPDTVSRIPDRKINIFVTEYINAIKGYGFYPSIKAAVQLLKLLKEEGLL